MYVKSATSGHHLPATIVRTSTWRRLTFLPYVEVVYLVNNGHRINWFYPEDVH